MLKDLVASRPSRMLMDVSRRVGPRGGMVLGLVAGGLPLAACTLLAELDAHTSQTVVSGDEAGLDGTALPDGGASDAARQPTCEERCLGGACPLDAGCAPFVFEAGADGAPLFATPGSMARLGGAVFLVDLGVPGAGGCAGTKLASGRLFKIDLASRTVTQVQGGLGCPNAVAVLKATHVCVVERNPTPDNDAGGRVSCFDNGQRVASTTGNPAASISATNDTLGSLLWLEEANGRITVVSGGLQGSSITRANGVGNITPPDEPSFPIAVNAPGGALVASKTGIRIAKGPVDGGTPFIDGGSVFALSQAGDFVAWVEDGAKSVMRRAYLDGGALPPVTLKGARVWQRLVLQDDGTVFASLTEPGGIVRVDPDGGTTTLMASDEVLPFSLLVLDDRVVFSTLTGGHVGWVAR